jgi:Secretion system C-terminal sorting domain
MKSRSLLLCFLVLFPGFITFYSSSITYAGNPGGGKPDADRMHQIRANQNTGVIDTRDMLKAQTQVNSMATEKAMSDINLDWKQLGPNNAAGRTRTVLFSNKDASGMTVFTGGVTGGIWKSKNLGLTWHQMNTQGNEVLRVTSMAQTSGGTIYVATGESFCNKNQYIGTGIYRSDDDSTFTLLPNTQPVFNNPASDWAYISKLAVSPSGRIFAATNAGLKYSDNGADWLMAKSGYAYTVTIGPDGTILTNIDNSAYIAVAGDISNFVNLSTNTPTTFPNTGVNGIEFAIAPSDANIMYASLANLSGGLLNVYKSADKGTTWAIVFPGSNTFNPLVNGCYANSLGVFPDDPNQLFIGGYNIWHGEKYQETGNYNWEQVSFAAVQEEQFELANFLVPAYQHQIVFRPGANNQFGIATDDGISIGTITSAGVSFQHMVKNCIISQFNSVAYSIKKESAFGGAVYLGAEYIPGGTVLNEPENGVQIYTGYGGDVAWSMINPTSVFFGTGFLSSFPAPYTYPFIRTEDLGVTPSPTFLGTITNNNYTPVTYWEDFNFTQSVDSVVYKNISGLIRKDSIFNVPSANAKFPMRYQAPYDLDSLASITVHDVVSTRFFLPGIQGGKAGIYMTKQALQFSIDPKWFRIANIDIADIVTCLTVSKDLGVLWAGTTKGKLYRLTNITFANDSTTAMADSAGCVIGHAVYDSTVYTQFKNRYITSIAIAPDNLTVLVTLGNYGNSTYVYKTTSGLDSVPVFAPVQGDLPAMPVYSGIFEMSNPNTVILGTDFGVFSTNNISSGSPTWAVQNAGTGNVPVTTIKQQTNPGLYYYRPANYGDLYLASFGRGLFFDETFGVVLGMDPIHTQPAAENRLKVQPNPFTNKVNISYKIGKTAAVHAMVYDLSGRMIFSTSFGTQQPGEYTQELNLGSLTSGTYIIKLDYGTGSSYGKALKVN